MRPVSIGVALWIGCSFAWGAAAWGQPDEAKKSDRDLFHGAWSIVKLESGGKPSAERNYVGNTLTFKDDAVVLKEGNHAPLEATFALDVADDLKTIDIELPRGPMLGIYRLNGDDLELCMSIGGTRPTTFSTGPDDRREKFTLKRGSPGELLDWKRFAAKEHGFSVELPGEPEKRLRNANSTEGPVEATFYVTRSDAERLSYMAVTLQLPYLTTEKEKIDAALDVFTKNMLAEFSGNGTVEVKRDQAFKQGNHSGRELSVSLDIPGGQRKAAAEVLAFFVEGRLFALMVVGVEEGLSAKNVKRFWDSFRLGDDS